jgi:plastocyanin
VSRPRVAVVVAAVHDRRPLRRSFGLRALGSILCALCVETSTTLAADVTFRLADAKTNQPVPDAVVSLTPLDFALPAAASAGAPPEIIQQHQEFSPFVTAVRAGSPIRFPNHDTVQHHVYSLSKPKKFEFPLYNPGQAETIVFDQPGVVVIGCNIHDWMLAYVVVLDTPWFAVTSAEGIAMLRDLPPGGYRTEVWHPRLAQPVARTVTLPADSGAPITLALALKPDRRIRRPSGPLRDSYR